MPRARLGGGGPGPAARSRYGTVDPRVPERAEVPSHPGVVHQLERLAVEEQVPVVRKPGELLSKALPAGAVSFPGFCEGCASGANREDSGPKWREGHEA